MKQLEVWFSVENTNKETEKHMIVVTEKTDIYEEVISYLNDEASGEFVDSKHDFTFERLDNERHNALVGWTDWKYNDKWSGGGFWVMWDYILENSTNEKLLKEMNDYEKDGVAGYMEAAIYAEFEKLGERNE